MWKNAHHNFQMLRLRIASWSNKQSKTKRLFIHCHQHQRKASSSSKCLTVLLEKWLKRWIDYATNHCSSDVCMMVIRQQELYPGQPSSRAKRTPQIWCLYSVFLHLLHLQKKQIHCLARGSWAVEAEPICVFVFNHLSSFQASSL